MRTIPLLLALLAGCGTSPSDAPATAHQVQAPPVSMTASPAVAGARFELQVTGVNPGEPVFFAYSLAGAGTGPAIAFFGGLQPDLANPVKPMPGGPVTADANGEATFGFDIPATAPVGLEVSLQALVRSGPGGVDSYVGNVITVEITGAPTLPAPTVAVDTSLPAPASLPGVSPGDPDRALAVLEGPQGESMAFVENELLVVGALADVQGWVNGLNGTIVQQLETTRLGGDHDTFLVRVTAPPASASALGAVLQDLRPGATGDHTVSTAWGLDLIALAAAENAADLVVGLNVVNEGATFRDLRSNEAPSTSAIAGYTRDAASWPHLSAGSPQDMDVVGAWRDMEVADRLDNRIGLMIFDMGFTASDAELPPLTAALSQVPGHAALGQPNISGCGGGNPCPWHGRAVASTAFAVPDDDFGGAGPAGPVADAMTLFTLYDYFSVISALVIAGDQGAQIVNMSYSANVPSVFDWTILPGRLATTVASNSGMILFAAAGNSSTDVDDETCILGWCWEGTFHTPCENEGVTCVGALELNGRGRAGYSNWGDRDVDLWAPGTTYVGPRPDAPETSMVSGTSMASPFAAGAAALVWAADPGMNQTTVLAHLLNTADAGDDAEVRRLVQPRDAVVSALGDVPPHLEIEAPGDGTTRVTGTPGVFLDADAEAFRGAVDVSWTSSRDGFLGDFASRNLQDLTPGTHVLTATARDTSGRTTTRSVTVDLTNPAPTVDIEAPGVPAVFFESESILLRATSSDPNEGGGTVPSGSFVWTNGGTTLGVGSEITASLPVGTHGVRVTATDRFGASGSDTVTITVMPDPVDLPPSVSIVSPATDSTTLDALWWDGSDAIGWYKDLTLVADAFDPEDGAIDGASVVWTVDGAFVGTGDSLPVRLHGECFGTWFDIVATVTDSGGNSRTALRRVLILTLC